VSCGWVFTVAISFRLAVPGVLIGGFLVPKSQLPF
jgi:hypothetical protein